jgi:hypothetical protein
MSRKSNREEPKSAVLTPDRIKAGITELKRRIKELEEFDILTIKKR